MTYDPGRDAAERYPDWTIRRICLGGHAFGVSIPSRKLIYIDVGLDRAGWDSTLAHELYHLDRGDRGTCRSEECIQRAEQRCEKEAARRMVPFRRLRRAFLIWGNDGHQLADELGVDLPLLHARFEGLHPSERHALRLAVEERGEVA